MEPLSLIGLGANVAGTVSKLFFGDQAAELQRRASLERLRRQELQQNQILGKATAAAASSGFAVDTSGRGTAPGQSSMGLFLSSMANEFRQQNTFAAQAAEQGYQLETQAAALGAAADFGQGLFRFGQANNFWMSKPAVS